MLILGIETSCDETGIALYDGEENKIIFESLFSQANKHSLYGGVVPELAARDHTNKLLPLLKKDFTHFSIPGIFYELDIYMLVNCLDYL